ncbi:hypothetical protein [Mesorhizobium sp.]|uniref:hypothetical protein n=1 Tax=Mesorhizobium sp. TaxID=1871066 RepID=UPI0025BAA46C|nr:hypothetical protein [Mesorhizobium sp.]
MSFEPTKDKLAVRGDRTAIERAVTNLVQNAIDHGRRRPRPAPRSRRASGR